MYTIKYSMYNVYYTIHNFSGVPLTSEDNECRTPEIVAQMYNQVDVLRVLDEERKRLQLIEVR